MGFLDRFRRPSTDETEAGDPGRLTTPNEPAVPREGDPGPPAAPGDDDASRIPPGGAADTAEQT
jgi:hypothetical protein